MIWKTIPGFFHYEISHYGNIRRAININTRGKKGYRKKPGEVLKTYGKYSVTNLINDNGRIVSVKASELVLITFVGPAPTIKHLATYQDSNTRNNHYKNLFWAIPQRKQKDHRKNAYKIHRSGAKQRNIPFLLSFDEWWSLWQNSGHWEKRGVRKGEYVMARYGDVGPYSIDNVRICTSEENHREALVGKKASPETILKMSLGQKGIPKGPNNYWSRLTSEQKEQWSLDRRGKRHKPRSKQDCLKISLRRTGMRWTTEQRQRMRDNWHSKRGLT